MDTPVQAVVEADRLVAAVMAERGYPMKEFDEMAESVSAGLLPSLYK